MYSTKQVISLNLAVEPKLELGIIKILGCECLYVHFLFVFIHIICYF
jgi:hypothetical protein